MNSSSDRDDEPRESKKSTGNPFIRFRQFADEQIGSLLQGIVGLPSAFTKNPGNTRWADFDEELRRRDELQARQRGLKESEARRTAREAEAATQTTAQQFEPSVAHVPEYIPSKVTENRDLPLYSPVTKSLFAHLVPADSDNDWNQYNRLVSLQDTYRMDYFPFKVKQDQRPSTSMEALQLMAYNELDGSDTFRSDYSLLPYLLFSPYSPIRLHLEDRNTRQLVTSATSPVNDFPYHVAFADLIQASHGWPESMRQRNTTSFSPFGSFSMFASSHSSVNWMSWIYDLYGGNLLQQRTSRDLPRLVDMIPPGIFSPSESMTEWTEGEPEDPDTEYDMYNQILQWASGPMISSALGAIDSIFENPDSALEKLLDALESPGGQRLLGKLKEFDASTPLCKDAILQYLRDEVNGKREEPVVAKATQDPERVVSTSTTTSHITREDGSIETSVTVWKRYANGNEVVKTTSNLNGDRNGISQAESDQPEQIAKTPEANQSEKKGWFWN